MSWTSPTRNTGPRPDRVFVPTREKCMLDAVHAALNRAIETIFESQPVRRIALTICFCLPISCCR